MSSRKHHESTQLQNLRRLGERTSGRSVHGKAASRPIRTKVALVESFQALSQACRTYMAMSDQQIMQEYRKVYSHEEVLSASCPACGQKLQIEDGKFPEHRGWGVNGDNCQKSNGTCNEVIHYVHANDLKHDQILAMDNEHAQNHAWFILAQECRAKLIQSAIHYQMLVLGLE